MPTGYKLVISRALGMHGIYCPQPSGTRPSGFGAINAIHPSRPWYNYYVCSHAWMIYGGNFSVSQDPGAKFPSNKICNQKYNLITFVPKVYNTKSI